MRKKFAFASTLALLLVLLSGSAARSTYSASPVTVTPDSCQSSCVAQCEACIASGQPSGYCLGQYHKCNNQCK